jgi:hypothetical protein
VTNTYTQYVNEYILDKQWALPADLHIQFPLIKNLVLQVTFPFNDHSDQLIWIHTTSVNLPLKEAFKFMKQHPPPPLMATLVWRLMMGKLPTNENLAQRGCYLPSICFLYSSITETSLHLFFACNYSLKIWNISSFSVTRRFMDA